MIFINRFGRQYQELWKDSEKKQPRSVANFKPNLLTHKSKVFNTGYVKTG